VSVEVLERASLQDELDTALNSIQTGGRVVLVTGEAGIGKSALVRDFSRRHEPSVRFLVGLCDPLLTPRALGPWHDIARQIGAGYAEQLTAGTTREEMFGQFLDELARHGQPQVVVVEDMHWADEATLDLLVFLGRRLERLPVLLVVTYRDDELGMDHPLRKAVGGLPPERVRRLRPRRLSAAAVTTLARRAGRSADRLHALTGGNPLLVTEVLAADAPGVPQTVADLVLARLATLDPEAQELARFVSVVPGRVELWALQEALRPRPAVVEACVAAGLLVLSGATVGFRHELTRQAVEESLSVLRRRELNGRVLEILSRHDVDPARLAHHAQFADAPQAVWRWAPAAAERAAAVGAHREAADHYRVALRHADGLPAPERAEWLEGYAYHGHLIGLVDEALAARREVVEIWTAAGRDDKVGENLSRLSRLYAWRSRRAEAEETAVRAVTILERREPGRQLAMAYSNVADLEMHAYRWNPAIEWASKAIDVARQVGDRETLAHALTSIGSIRLGTGDEPGRADLEQAVEMTVAEGLHDHAVRALVFLARIPLEDRDYPRARENLDRALGFARAHDLVGYVQYLTATQAWWRLDQGDWEGAYRDARQALGGQEQPGIGVWFTLTHLGRLQARRGDAEAAETLAAAREHTVDGADLLRVARVAAARAEHAWLCGDTDGVVAAAARGFECAVRFGRTTPRLVTATWYAGELAWWLWRAGRRPKKVPDWIAEPYRLLLNGEWRRAAELWAARGCPYEQAEALSCGTENSALLQALDLYDGLGAVAAARRLRHRLQRDGTVRVPRGPRATTVGNPGRLTARQLEVLALLGERLTNTDIATKLSLSVRTVDHHVAAIFAKLGVSSRWEAVRAGRRLGVIPADGRGPTGLGTTRRGPR
jgi:DNA-binding CsgD family transcriptional regulator/tetratricopeptide (TPR) repeat protein